MTCGGERVVEGPNGAGGTVPMGAPALGWDGP